MAEPVSVMGPVPAKARIETLDVLRGFAIFGILLVNMEAYNSPFLYLDTAGEQWWTGTADRVAQYLIFYLARGKFVSMLSFLFGLGFALQLLRAEARGTEDHPGWYNFRTDPQELAAEADVLLRELEAAAAKGSRIWILVGDRNSRKTESKVFYRVLERGRYRLQIDPEHNNEEVRNRAAIYCLTAR